MAVDNPIAWQYIHSVRKLFNMNVRLPPEMVREVDEIVAKTNERRASTVAGIETEMSRASIVRYWIERGIKEAKRPRK